VGQKLSRQRLERDLRPCPWRKSKNIYEKPCKLRIMCHFLANVDMSACFSNNLVYLCRYAGAVFGDACLKGLNGVPDIVECSYVQSTITELPFFASKVHVYFARTIFFYRHFYRLYNFMKKF
jgi:hypothetical protein